MKRTLCNDDRGRAYSLLNRTICNDLPADDYRIRNLARRISAERTHTDWPTLGMSLLRLLGVVMACAVILLLSKWLLRTLRLSDSLVALPTAAGVFFFYLLLRPFQRYISLTAQRTSAILLDEGLCPSCCYNLHCIPAQSDNCRICPECGCAWLNSRIRRSAAFNGSKMRHAFQSLFLNIGSFNVSIRDIHNHPYALANWSRLHTHGTCSHSESRSLYQSLKRSILRQSRIARWLVFLISLPLTILLTSYSLQHASTGNNQYIASIIPILVLICLLIFFVPIPLRPKHLITALLEHHRCPACGYNLVPHTPPENPASPLLRCNFCMAHWQPHAPPQSIASAR